MLSSIFGFGYHKIPQGKKIREWISNNKVWFLKYITELHDLFCETAKNPKPQTIIKYRCLISLLNCECMSEKYIKPTTAILRYIKGYKCEYPTDTELPIDECIKIYQDYVIWKEW